MQSRLHRRNYGDEQRMVERLFLWAWPGGKNDYWTKCEGLERRKTALSDHLEQLFRDWSKGTLGIVADFEELYETWEILGSIAYAETVSTEALQAVAESTDRNHFEWMPVGRSVWHGDMRERIFANILSAPLRDELLAGGFAKRDSRHLELSIGNFQRIAGRMRF